MTPQQKANELANKFVTKSIFDMSNEELQKERILAKKHALVCVDEIAISLMVTTGHCELRKLDQQEVEKDFAFWAKVKTEIQKL